MINPPLSLKELQMRVNELSGRTLGSIAQSLNIQVPINLQREKGWVGQLLEKVLGTSAGNQSEPDFLELGIELKTIPVNAKGTPQESTYVCVVPLSNLTGLNWESSHVKKKLNQVLWIPIETEKEIPLANRRVGMGLFWTMDEETENRLKCDYDEFVEQIAFGKVDKITASQGELLQIRPKAANASKVTVGIGEDGEQIKTLPRGFYLRPAFTKKILSDWKNIPLKF